MKFVLYYKIRKIARKRRCVVIEKQEYIVSSPACVSIPVSDVEALLACENSDCIRIYLYLKRWGKPRDEQRVSEDLHLPFHVVQAAIAQLRRMGLLSGKAASAAPAEELPQYDADYIVSRTQADATFRVLLEEAAQILGRKLSTTEMQKLFGIYDDLGLPAEVILMMMNHCKDECAERYGPGRVPTMRQVEKEAYLWARLEIFTLEQAEDYVARCQKKKDSVRSIQRALGIRDRELSVTEKNYLESWLELGFSEDAVLIAYDRTVTQTGGLKWPYMNQILRNWHQKGLYTPEAIREGDVLPGRSRKAATPTEKPAVTAGGEKERLLKLYESIKK